MGTIQKQSLFVGIDFTKLLGSKEARAKNISIKIAERNADIYAERQARRFAVVSDSQYAKVLAQHDAVMTELNAVCANQTDPLSTQYEKRMALSRRLVIVGNRLKKAEKEHKRGRPFCFKFKVFGHKLSLIFTDNYSGFRRLNPRLARRD